MAMTTRHKIVSSKIDLLVEQRNNLLTYVDEINEVLQHTTSWLANTDDSNNFTFNEINKMIEDKLVFLGNVDFFGDAGTPTTHQESVAKGPFQQSTDQTMPTRVGYASAAPNEIKTLMNQVKVLQDAMSFLSLNSEKLSEKQLDTERFAESMSEKYSKIEQEKIREIERELKSVSEKQKKAEIQQEKIMTGFEKKIQAVTDSQSSIDENWQIQQSKVNDNKKEIERLQKQSQQFMKDLNNVLENINTQAGVLENQTIINKQIEVLENKVEVLKISSKDLSTKLEEQGSIFEKLKKKTEETLKDLTLVRESDFEKLHKFEEKILALETTNHKTSQENEKLCQDVKTKSEMVYQVVADRLVPLERLRDMFNDKLDVRKEYMRKLDSVCDQMADLLPKFSHLETWTKRPPIGFSARMHSDLKIVISRNSVIFPHIISNIGNHFDPTTGEFTVPLDGLYAVSLCAYFEGNCDLTLTIMNLSWNSLESKFQEYILGRIIMKQSVSKHANTFSLKEIIAGGKLFVKCEHFDLGSNLPKSILSIFSCFRIT